MGIMPCILLMYIYIYIYIYVHKTHFGVLSICMVYIVPCWLLLPFHLAYASARLVACLCWLLDGHCILNGSSAAYMRCKCLGEAWRSQQALGMLSSRSGSRTGQLGSSVSGCHTVGYLFTVHYYQFSCRTGPQMNTFFASLFKGLKVCVSSNKSTILWNH